MKRILTPLLLCLSLLVSSYSCGKQEAPGPLFPVVQKGKCGYINRTGKIVIEPQFNGADDFSEGLARVTIEAKFGYINKAGQMVIKPQQFDWAENFSEGLALVEIDGKIGYIDKTGQYIWKPAK